MAFCVIVPFLMYCVYYYSGMVKNAPYRFADFESIVFKYGEPDHMLNEYNSANNHYQYLNKKDSLIVDTLILRKDDLLYLHRKAQELGFWNLPDEMLGTAALEGKKNSQVPRYYLAFKYKEKTKVVTMDADFVGNEKMRDAAKSVIDEVNKTLATAQAR